MPAAGAGGGGAGGGGKASAPVELSVEQKSFKALGRALGAAADGKRLKRELAKRLRKAVEPAVADARGNVAGMSSRGRRVGAPLRASVARQVKAQVRYTGRNTGVRIRAAKRGMPREFSNAPKRLNAAGGWRRMVFGNREVWVEQVGQPDWFDDAMVARQEEARAAVLDAMQAALDQLGRDAKK